jgi:hypothetical protein
LVSGSPVGIERFAVTNAASDAQLALFNALREEIIHHMTARDNMLN